MNPWTHAICERCWADRQDGREPVRLEDPDTETCCFCGEATMSGIYLRADPLYTPCRGKHKQEKETS